MDTRFPLHTATLVGFVATAEPLAARRFYEGVLGLRLIEDSPFALVFAAGATNLRVQKVGFVTAAAYTALGWQVEDISAAVEALSDKGVYSSASLVCRKTKRESGARQMGPPWHGSEIQTEIPSHSPSMPHMTPCIFQKKAVELIRRLS